MKAAAFQPHFTGRVAELLAKQDAIALRAAEAPDVARRRAERRLRRACAEQLYQLHLTGPY